jgi:hypothetical protein
MGRRVTMPLPLGRNSLPMMLSSNELLPGYDVGGTCGL